MKPDSYHFIEHDFDGMLKEVLENKFALEHVKGRMIDAGIDTGMIGNFMDAMIQRFQFDDYQKFVMN